MFLIILFNRKTDIQDNGCTDLKECMSKLTKMNYLDLDLSYDKISDIGIKELSSGIVKLEKLTHL